MKTRDLRCQRCGRKLAELESGSVRIKCPRCRVVFAFELHGSMVDAHAVDEGPRRPGRDASTRPREAR